MSTNLVIQSLKDQFLHWRRDMERKQEEKARQMKELRAHVERLQRENYLLCAQMEKSRDLGDEVRGSGRATYPITHNKGKELIIPANVDTPVDDGKMGETHTFWAFFGDLYRYTLNMYRYSPLESNLYRYRCGTGAVHPALF